MTPRGRCARGAGHLDELAALNARVLVAVDASAYFSRPGPRLIDGLELLAHILHPELLAAPAGALALALEPHGAHR